MSGGRVHATMVVLADFVITASGCKAAFVVVVVEAPRGCRGLRQTLRRRRWQ